ncbi:hypothetical protein [Kineosporia succinea]|uniref:Uncharacterized protein n=1 Tax=Kineosporia succinea TaxID=84632 RepID=A0ABT9P5U2_9ACTN|nr:hypothetical protein [Kineosporia succinea]MDP9828058.1 hypothetical protein [Kineosporia succinea]
MPAFPRIRRATPGETVNVYDPPLPVLAGIRFPDITQTGKGKQWTEPREYGCIAIAWTNNPDAVQIRWQMEPNDPLFEDWIDAGDVRYLET